MKDTADIGNIILQQKGNIPVFVKDVAKVEIGHAPRLGQFGYMKQDEAVEGVILMRVGEQAQVVLRKVDGAEVLRRVEEHGVTLLNGAPTVIAMVLAAAKEWDGEIPGRDRVRVVVAGDPPPSRT